MIPSCECPHRLSDKLLKSGVVGRKLPATRAAYITLTRFRVKLFFALLNYIRNAVQWRRIIGSFTRAAIAN